jgi:hypothetical protein
MRIGHHSSDTAEQEPLELEHRGYVDFPEATVGPAADLYLGTQVDRWLTGGGGYCSS